MSAMLLGCTRCGQTNRISSEKRPTAARCGKCHEPLFAGRAVEVTEGVFNRHLAADDLPMLVDVWAPWCGPCRMMSPAFDAAAGSLEPDVRLFKLNADAAPALSQRFAVRSIPTIMLFRKGELLGRSSGVMNTPQIVAWTRQHLPHAAAA